MKKKIQIIRELKITDGKFDWARKILGIEEVQPLRYSEADVMRIRNFFSFEDCPPGLVKVKDAAFQCDISVMAFEKYAKILNIQRDKSRYKGDTHFFVRYPEESITLIQDYVEKHHDEITKFYRKSHIAPKQKKAMAEKIRLALEEKMRWAKTHLTTLSEEIIRKTYQEEWFPDAVPVFFKGEDEDDGK